MLKIEKSRLGELFSKISQAEALYIPVNNQNGDAKFTLWQEGLTLSENTNTLRSAKDFFFPQTEDIADFKRKGQHIEIIDHRTESEDFVIFGVRGCDVKSFDILDSVFLSQPVDSFYENRRKHATIISMVCNEPENTCFCGAFGIDCTNPGGDVVACLTKEHLYLEAQTDKGERLISSVRELLSPAEAVEVQEWLQQVKEKLARLPLSGLCPKDLREKQLEAFNNEKWSELSRTCLGCGTCTFVCPTCQCYDIKEFNAGDTIKRFRCWDSCMYSDFTLMAAGTPRLTQLERFRQRFMHKLVYYPMNNEGIYGCVGCGRCLQKCPISMNIVKVMMEIGGASNGK